MKWLILCLLMITQMTVSTAWAADDSETYLDSDEDIELSMDEDEEDIDLSDSDEEDEEEDVAEQVVVPTEPKTIATTPPPTVKATAKKLKSKKAHSRKVAKKTSWKKRTIASAFKQGLKRSTKSCEMHASPNSKSTVVLNVKKRKKLWLEKHNSYWYKGFRKGGHGYLSADCF